MSSAANLDTWAFSNLNYFFTADSNPPSGNDGDLTGQCVTLVKWFFNDFCNIPNPFNGRGDARYVGQTLVNQGLADKIPAGQQKPGDLVAYEFGQYGHIAVLISEGRIFQQNAAVAGATKKTLTNGTVVYSSTIVPMYASLSGVAPTFYRVKSFIGSNTMNEKQASDLALYIRLLGFETVASANSHNADDVKHILADPAYAAAMAKQIYAGQWQVPAWKAGNYDANVKAAHDQGFQEGEAAAGGGDGYTYSPVAEVNGEPSLFIRNVKE